MMLGRFSVGNLAMSGLQSEQSMKHMLSSWWHRHSFCLCRTGTNQ
jgi:hypothetical protein